MTTSAAKTIQIYLPTGEPRGIRIAEITTCIVQALLIPRSDLAEGKERKELGLPGVYFLFGEDEDNAKPIVYIGQTEDAGKRFDSHSRTKNFWKTAILCVSKTQNFTQAHIRYLEWYCMQRAKEVNRFALSNEQVPSSPNYVTESMEAELLDVFETISILVSALGYPVFDSLGIRQDRSDAFYCRSRGCDAFGTLVEDGFVVHKGSRSRIESAPSIPDSVRNRRHKMLDQRVMSEQDGAYVYLEDYLFSSPSAAASTVLAAPANGWMEWKNKDGLTLSEMHRDSGAEDESD